MTDQGHCWAQVQRRRHPLLLASLRRLLMQHCMVQRPATGLGAAARLERSMHAQRAKRRHGLRFCAWPGQACLRRGWLLVLVMRLLAGVAHRPHNGRPGAVICC